MPNYKTTPVFTTTYPKRFYALTRHMYQTKKIHLILTSNNNFEIKKALLTHHKYETTELHLIFQQTYQNSIEENDVS